MDYFFAVGHCEQETWNRITQNIRWQHTRLQVGIKICSYHKWQCILFHSISTASLNFCPTGIANLFILKARQCPFIRVQCCLQNMAWVDHACPWLGICVANNAGLKAWKMCICHAGGCCLSGMHLSQGRNKLNSQRWWFCSKFRNVRIWHTHSYFPTTWGKQIPCCRSTLPPHFKPWWVPPNQLGSQWDMFLAFFLGGNRSIIYCIVCIYFTYVVMCV